MPFSERTSLLKDESRPLLRDPVWCHSHRYGVGGRRYGEEMGDLGAGGFESSRTQRFQWILFLSVTLLSILILLGTLGVLIKLSQTHPSVIPKNDLTTTTAPVKSTVSTTTTTTTSTPVVVVTSTSSTDIQNSSLPNPSETLSKRPQQSN